MQNQFTIPIVRSDDDIVSMRNRYALALLALPILVATIFDTWSDTAVHFYVLAGVMTLAPAARVLFFEGWRGWFTATTVVSVTAYILYCNSTIALGDLLVASQNHSYPAISTSVRNEAALVNLGGCTALALGLLLGYRPRKVTMLKEYLDYGDIFISNAALRNAVLAITFVFVSARMGLVISAGISPIDFLLGSRASGSHFEFAGNAVALAHLANVFQVAAIMGGALLLARRSKLPGVKTVAIIAIATPLLFALLRGARGYTMGFVLALLAFGVTVPVPRIQRFSRRLVPVMVVVGVLVFAYQTVYRNVGVQAIFESNSSAQEIELKEGFRSLFAYEQATMLELSMFLTPERYPALGGETLVALPVNFVPRALWPQKPTSLGPVLAQRLGLENVTLSAGLIGEGWCNFLLPGALLLPFFFGLFASSWDRLRNFSRVWPDGYALWAAGLPGLFLTVRGDFLTGGALFMYNAIGIGAILLFFARYQFRNRAQARAMLSGRA